MEVDLDIMRDDLTQFKPNKPKMIHRVVLNNQTISIFDNFDYHTIDTTIILPDLSIDNYKEN